MTRLGVLAVSVWVDKVIANVQTLVHVAYSPFTMGENGVAYIDFGDGSISGPIGVSGENGQGSVYHVWAVPGVYTVTANCDDGLGSTGSGSASITVSAPGTNPLLWVALAVVVAMALQRKQ